MKKILIIDDAATVRMYHRGILESAGYAVEEAFNGIEALEKVLEIDFDLLIVDINMPQLDGQEFLRRLRCEEITQTPAIMVSTEAESNDRNVAFVSGANDYLIKPTKPAQLLSHVRLLLGEPNP